jgi:CheY-like chemotaxis protein
VSHVSDHPLLFALDAPAAIVGDAGALLGWNAAFADWAADNDVAALAAARVEAHGDHGVLTAPARDPRPLALARLKGGGWLAQVTTKASRDSVRAMIGVFGENLARIDRVLADSLTMALREARSEGLAHLLRDALAARDELGTLREHVEALRNGGRARNPVCLRTLVREVARQFPSGSIRVETDDADATVELNSALAFSHLYAAFAALLAHGVCVVRVTVAAPTTPDVSTRRPYTPNATPMVRVECAVGATVAALRADPSISAATQFFTAAGGSLHLHGSTLSLAVPLWQPPVAERAHAGTVLVVDDDPVTRAMMGAALRSAGWTVLVADNGVAASALLRQHAHEIALVVADAVLPGRSGTELLEEASRLAQPVPVLLVSGHPSDLLGVDEYGSIPLLPKPFGARALADTVGRLARVVSRA